MDAGAGSPTKIAISGTSANRTEKRASDMTQKPTPEGHRVRKILIKCSLSPGDILVITAAVESLHTAYPGQYQTGVATSAMPLWDHNPRVSRFSQDDQEVETVDLKDVTQEENPINRSNGIGYPCLDCMSQILGKKLGIPLRLTTNRPHVYLSEEEKKWRPQLVDSRRELEGRMIPYWLVNAGVKTCYPAKQWPVEHYQEVIDRTRGRIQWVQVGDITGDHYHPTLRGVVSLVGKTDHRQMVRLAYHARGGLGPVTYLQHLCAAWEKPYLCLLGGREPVTWVAYPKQHTFHTIGQYPCCAKQACWKSRIVKAHDGSDKDKSLCDFPVIGLERPVAKCMASILPEEVCAVLWRMAPHG